MDERQVQQWLEELNEAAQGNRSIGASRLTTSSPTTFYDSELSDAMSHQRSLYSAESWQTLERGIYRDILSSVDAADSRLSNAVSVLGLTLRPEEGAPNKLVTIVRRTETMRSSDHYLRSLKAAERILSTYRRRFERELRRQRSPRNTLANGLSTGEPLENTANSWIQDDEETESESWYSGDQQE